MTQYHVNAAEIAEAASRATASASTIRSEVAAMVAHLTGLEASWQGGASHAFTGLLAEWRAAQAQLEHALDSISTGLNQAASEYEYAETSAMRLFNR
jgi:WXG100 family type VII secretion target